MTEELIMEVDENNKQIGLRPRKDFYNGKYIHRGVHLMLFNSRKEVAIMKRSSGKRWYPNLYTFSVSGGAVNNETNIEGIARETKEEIGLELKPKELFTFRYYDEHDNAFATLFYAISDKTITPDKAEIARVDWITLDWLKEDMKNNPEKYTHTMREGMKVDFEKYGANLPH